MPVTLSTKSADCDTASEPSNNLEEAGHSNDSRGCRRIQVSREKRPIHFFISLAKKFLCTDNVVELSGLGLAVTTVVTIVERLREEHLVHIKEIQTSLVEPHPDGSSTAPKAKIQIWVEKTELYDQIMTPYNYSRRSTHQDGEFTQEATYKRDDHLNESDDVIGGTGDTNGLSAQDASGSSLVSPIKQTDENAVGQESFRDDNRPDTDPQSAS